MKVILKTLAIISILLLSVAFFIWVYQSVGVVFTIKCLFAWGWSIMCYVCLLWVIYMIFPEIEIY